MNLGSLYSSKKNVTLSLFGNGVCTTTIAAIRDLQLGALSLFGSSQRGKIGHIVGHTSHQLNVGLPAGLDGVVHLANEE